MAGLKKYQAYPEYKESGVEWLGEIPEGWEVTRLKYTTYINMGQSPSSEDCNIDGNGFPFLQGNAEFGKINPVEKQYCSLAKKISPYGAILFSVRAPVGAINIADKHYAIGRGLCSISAASKTNIPFLWWFLPTYKYQLDAIATGSTFEAVSSEQLGNLRYALPSISEQNTIATFLKHETAKIDKLIKRQQQLIELLKEKRQAVISHAVTKGLNSDVPMKDSGVEWLEEVPEHWAVAKLSFKYEVLLGKMLDEKKITGKFLGHYLRNTDVQWGNINIEDLPLMDFRFEERERYSIKKGDLIVCEGGEIGRCAVWIKETQCFYQKALHRLRPLNNDGNTKFLFYVLYSTVKQGRFISDAGKATIAHLPAEILKQYKFAFPPINEQIKIVDYLDKHSEFFNKIEEKSTEQISLLQERRTALISAAVTGKIDVRNWVAPASEAETLTEAYA